MEKHNLFSNKVVGFLLTVLVVLGLSLAEAQKGYQIVGDAVVVDRTSHWQQWTIPTHLARVDAAGSVHARSLRTVFNVLDDPEFKRPIVISKPEPRIGTIDSTMQFDVFGEPIRNTLDKLVFDHWVRPGISRVGSNPHLAQAILDGDPTTFWEPDPSDPIDRWWIEVDLGRVVPVERLRLRFVDEGLGDPFLRYIMLFSNRQSALLNESNSRIGFQLFIPQDSPNTTQREYIFESEHISSELPPASGIVSDKKLIESSRRSPEWTGRMIETIRIVITDTRGGQAEKISQAQWEALPSGKRGDVVYFALDVAGHEEPVDEVTYGELVPERQGRRDFYRRELPRLAEVEAWGWGDNVGINLIENGGSYELTTDGINTSLIFDGDAATAISHQIRNPKNPLANVLTVDLGGIVRLAQTRIVGSTRGYIMRSSTGERDAQGNLKWRRISPVERERNVFTGYFYDIADVQDRPVLTRFIDMVTLGHVPPGFRATGPGGTGHMNQFWSSIHEMMLFAGGPPAEVVLKSDLIELPGLVALGAVNWLADTSPGTGVEIRTRTGDQLLQQIRYFDKTGNQKTADEYKKLAGFLKGPSDTTVVVGPGWSAWSQQYRQPGELVTSPSLRRFMQLQARLTSDGGEAVPALHRIAVDFDQPVVQRLRAEVFPTVVQAGVLDTFSLFVQPDFLERPVAVRSLGFDEVLLRAEPALDLQLVDVALGTEAEFEAGTVNQHFVRGADDQWSDASGAALAVHASGDSLWLGFPSALQGVESSVLTPIYYRSVQPGDEVSTGLDRNPLTFSSYQLLPELERGAVRHFRRLSTGELVEVDAESYEALEALEQGPVRYFRKVVGLGDQVPFDTAGAVLDESGYSRLGSERGWMVGRGRLMRVRFASQVYLQATRLDVAVRRSRPQTPWQGADGEDVTALSASKGLAVGTQGARLAIGDIEIGPNPFTPNGDGVNDVVSVDFALYRVQAARPLRLGIYALSGDRIRQIEELVTGGEQRFGWDGRDDQGRVVAPGLYLCRIEVEADAEAFAGQVQTRIIAVAY